LQFRAEMPQNISFNVPIDVFKIPSTLLEQACRSIREQVWPVRSRSGAWESVDMLKEIIGCKHVDEESVGDGDVKGRSMPCGLSGMHRGAWGLSRGAWGRG